MDVESSPPPPATPEQSLRARLLGAVRSHGRAAPPSASPPPRVDPAALERILAGSWRETESGRAFVVEERFPFDHAHGNTTLERTFRLGAEQLAPLLSRSRAERAALRGERLGFFDLETTGTSGGTGTYIFLAGLGVFEEDAFRLRQYFLVEPADERPMLEVLVRDLAGIDGLVTYNGRSFDVPCLETRITLARLENPCRDVPHIDLLHVVRALQRHRLESCRLGEVERHVLRHEREDDVPGWLVPSLYFDYIRARRIAPLRGVLRHNRDDILSLVGLLDRAAGLFERDDIDGSDAAAVGRWWELSDEPEQAAGFYRKALSLLEGSDDWSGVAARHALLCKRRGERSEALEIWRRLWTAGSRAAGLELAKHYEHRERDFDAALAITGALLEAAVDDEREDLLHRRKRLRARRARAGGVAPVPER